MVNNQSLQILNLEGGVCVWDWPTIKRSFFPFVSCLFPEKNVWSQPHSQASLLPALRRAGRREPWERGWVISCLWLGVPATRLLSCEFLRHENEALTLSAHRCNKKVVKPPPMRPCSSQNGTVVIWYSKKQISAKARLRNTKSNNWLDSVIM